MEGNAYGNLEHSVATTVNAHLDSKAAIVKVYILLLILSKAYKIWHKRGAIMATRYAIISPHCEMDK